MSESQALETQTETIDKLVAFDGLLCKNKNKLLTVLFSFDIYDHGYIAVSIDDKMEMLRRMGRSES